MLLNSAVCVDHVDSSRGIPTCLKQYTLVVVLRLLRDLLQVLGPTCDKFCIPDFDLRKGNFNVLLQERVATPLSPIVQKTLLK